MKRFLCLAVLVGLVGCSKQTDEPVQPESSPVAAAATLVAPPPALTQQVITDENGTQRTITVPVVPQAVTPIPPASVPTLDSVCLDLEAVLKEIMDILDKTPDMGTVQISKSMQQRVREVVQRVSGPNPDLVLAQKEISHIRAALARCK